MLKEIKDAPRGSGFRSSSSCLGGSVANANAANVSWIKFTQSNWTAVKVEDSLPLAIEVTNAKPTAVMLTVS